MTARARRPKSEMLPIFWVEISGYFKPIVLARVSTANGDRPSNWAISRMLFEPNHLRSLLSSLRVHGSRLLGYAIPVTKLFLRKAI